MGAGDNNIPITVYDVEDRKAVMIFSSGKTCSLYCFGRESYNIIQYANTKARNIENRFKRLIAFRHANDEHKKLLENVLHGKQLILDDRYKKPLQIEFDRIIKIRKNGKKTNVI